MGTPLPSLVIATGTGTSNALSFQHLRRARSILIVSPASLDSLTFTVEVAATHTPASGDWATLNNGSDVALSAGKALLLQNIAFTGLRIKASNNVAADRTFTVSIEEC